MLRGRSEESRLLDRLLEAARAGQSSVVSSFAGGAGWASPLCSSTSPNGRPAAGSRAHAGWSPRRSSRTPACCNCVGGPMLERAEQLAAPQRDALLRAFGLTDGPAPESFLVSLAALSLLSSAAEERPLVCLVDDVQWLDRESVSALSFVARRLEAEPIAMVFAVREPSAEQELDGLPELVLEGLGAGDARAAPGGGGAGRARRAGARADRGRDEGQSARAAGAAARADAGRARRRLRAARRARSCPAGSSRASCAGCSRFRPRRSACCSSQRPRPSATRPWSRGRPRSSESRPTRWFPPRTPSSIEFGPRVRFRHPLVRSASYRAATPHERRQAHEALAAATDPERDPDRRAWHRAHAAAGPDESVAAELERSASRARARGGVAAAAAFLEQAAELTPDPARRGTRALAAAQLKFEAGAPDAAEHLLAIASTSPLEELDHARVERLRAKIAFARTCGGDSRRCSAPRAKRLEPLDPELARETHLEALWAAVRSGRFVKAEGVVEAAAAAALPAGQEPARAIDLLLAGSGRAHDARGTSRRCRRWRARSRPSAPRDSAARTSPGAGSRASSRWTSGTTLPARRSRAGSCRVARERGGLTDPSLRAELLRRAPALPRRVRRRGAAGPGGGGDHRRDPERPARGLLRAARRLARRAGADGRAARGDDRGGDGARRGVRGRGRRVGGRGAAQRPRRVRRGGGRGGARLRRRTGSDSASGCCPS